MTGRLLTREQYEVLIFTARNAAVLGIFPGLAEGVIDSPETPAAGIREARAYMAILAADELGMSRIDALNRVRFTDQGLTFAPAVDKTFEDVLRHNVAETQKDAKREARKDASPRFDHVITNAERVLNIPKGFMPEGKLILDCTPGELAYFIDASQKKGAFLDARTFAWKVLSWKIKDASALELGKMTRWICNPKTPDLKVYFKDVLVAAEARIEELGETAAAGVA